MPSSAWEACARVLFFSDHVRDDLSHTHRFGHRVSLCAKTEYLAPSYVYALSSLSCVSRFSIPARRFTSHLFLSIYARPTFHPVLLICRRFSRRDVSSKRLKFNNATVLFCGIYFLYFLSLSFPFSSLCPYRGHMSVTLLLFRFFSSYLENLDVIFSSDSSEVYVTLAPIISQILAIARWASRIPDLAQDLSQDRIWTWREHYERLFRIVASDNRNCKRERESARNRDFQVDEAATDARDTLYALAALRRALRAVSESLPI